MSGFHRDFVNTLTPTQDFYRAFGLTPVGRLPGTIQCPLKAIHVLDNVWRATGLHCRRINRYLKHLDVRVLIN